MRVKRYIVNAVPDALPIIRSEMGKDAVILHTKEVKVGGVLGFFRKKKVEVLAAVESGSPSKEPAAERGAAPKGAAGKSSTGRFAEPKPAGIAAASASSQRSAPARSMPGQDAQAVATMDAQAPRAVSPAAVSLQYAAAHRKDAASGLPPAGMAAQARHSRLPADGHDERLLGEIREMASSIRLLTRQYAEQMLPDTLRRLRERLLQQEVSSSLIDRLLEQLQAHPGFVEASGSDPQIRQLAGGILREWLEPCTGGGIAADTKAVHFVGPTGVGKTTTIAKLAAEQLLKQGRKVGLVTADTYRIAAVDQLRTYANILNVPLEVVFSPSEASRAFQLLADRDLVLMDTAGRSYRSELQVSEVGSLLHAGPDSETFLVLSLTGKTKDMLDVAEPFIRHGVRKVLFTKLDETTVYGAVLNLVLERGMMPTYIAFGQTVPDDIEEFRAASYVERLLGGPDNE